MRSLSDGRRYNNIWDGWNLIVTYDGTNNWIIAPTHSRNGIEYEFNTTTHTTAMMYGDASGSTTHLADGGTGQLLEWYRYDLDGTPIIYDANNNPRTASAYNLRHLFTGQQWYSELGLYDLRNRFYSPDIGRFLQPDPISFNGDATNLYRYCGNNPLKFSDPLGTNVAFFINGLHGFVGVTNPASRQTGMTYFDFTMTPIGLLTAGLLAPGEWRAHNWQPAGYQYATIITTPEEDARVLAALNDRVAEQDDIYSLVFNNCFTAPANIIQRRAR